MKKVMVFARRVELFENLIAGLDGRDLMLERAANDDIALYLDDNTEEAYVYTDHGVFDLADFDQMIVLAFRTEQMHFLSSLAIWAKRHGKKMFDDAFSGTGGKLFEMWNLHAAGVQVPATAFGPTEFLVKVLNEKFGGVAVLKDLRGTKGQENYLVHSEAELREILAKAPEGMEYILQEFIPNEGDYRVICLNYQEKLAIRRWSNTGDHRNNTSLGGSAEVVEVSDEIRAISEKASEVMERKFAGVDVILHKETGKIYVLEVNHTPQVMSGAFVEQKREVMLDFFEEN